MKKVLVLSVLCLVALFALQYCYALSNSQPELQQSTQVDSSTNSKQTPNVNKFPWGIIWGLVITSGLFASLLTIVVTRRLFSLDNKNKRHALIIAFAYELVLAYHRCVIYYLQQQKSNTEVSYSRIYYYTDISSLPSYSAAFPKSNIIASIAYLKAIYFQIANHVDEAFRLAAEARAELNRQISDEILEKARRARDTALVFFLAKYHSEIHEDIQNRTLEIINEMSPNNTQEELCRIFSKAKEVKSELDTFVDEEKKVPQNRLKELEKELNDCLVQKSQQALTKQKKRPAKIG